MGSFLQLTNKFMFKENIPRIFDNTSDFKNDSTDINNYQNPKWEGENERRLVVSINFILIG